MRLEDNPALVAAAATGRPVIPVFILPAGEEEGGYPLRGAARFWQHHSLNHLQHALSHLGSALVLRDGANGGTLAQLLGVLQESAATEVFHCACYEPWLRQRDDEIATSLTAAGVAVHQLVGSILYAPWDAKPDEKAGGPLGFGSVGYFLNGCRDCPEPPPPLPPPTRLRSPSSWPSSLALSALGLAAMPRRTDGSLVDCERAHASNVPALP